MAGRKFRLVNFFYSPRFNHSDSVQSWNWSLIALSSTFYSYINFFVNRLILPFSSTSSIIGFMLLLMIALQLLSGFYLAWYYIPEPGLVVELREEMFNDTRFGAEIYHLHVRGVDVIFFLSYIHIFKKIYLKNYIHVDADGWFVGGYAFLWYHYVVALGICLSASHLSDLTLTIIANIFWSLTNNTYKTYYLIFTNKHLNTDQLARIMIFHYITPWYYLYLIQVHVLFCHENWDSDSGDATYEDKSLSYVSWFFDAFQKELQDGWFWAVTVGIFWWEHIFHLPTTAFNFFERWNIAENNDIRFYGVAPHWYFRPLMGVLVISPTHYEGLMWIIFYFLLISILPITHNFLNINRSPIAILPMNSSILQTTFFWLFLLSITIISSMLPCGRYYYEPEGGYVGNPIVKFSLQYIYLYLLLLLPLIDRIDNYLWRFYRNLYR